MGLTELSVNIGLDVFDHDTTPTTTKANALDSQTRVITAQVFNGGQTYDVGENAEVTLNVLRPDGACVEIGGGVFEYDVAEDVAIHGVTAELSQASLAVKGKAEAQFLIKSGEQELRTEIFTINIGRALDADASEWAGMYQGVDVKGLETRVEILEHAIAHEDFINADTEEY